MKNITVDAAMRLSEDEFIRLTTERLTDRDLPMIVTRYEESVLKGIQSKDGEASERYRFFKSIRDNLYRAMQAEEEINFWKQVAIKAKIDAELSRDMASLYWQELMKYKSIQEALEAGTLDQLIEQIKKTQRP